MSDVTTGPIQTYVDNSSVSSSTMTQDSTQENVSVTLADSNLWLVDTTKLNGQTVDTQEQYTLLNLQTKEQTTTSFENVDFTATSVGANGGFTSESSYLQSNLPDGSALMLTSVTGGTQLSSEGLSLTATGSSGGSTGEMSTSESGGSASGTGSSSGGTTSAAPGSSGSSDSSGSSGSATDGQLTQVVTLDGSQTITSQPTASPQVAEPVPFEVSPAIGLLLLLLMFGSRMMLKTTVAKSLRVLLN